MLMKYYGKRLKVTWQNSHKIVLTKRASDEPGGFAICGWPANLPPSGLSVE